MNDYFFIFKAESDPVNPDTTLMVLPSPYTSACTRSFLHCFLASLHPFLAAFTTSLSHVLV